MERVSEPTRPTGLLRLLFRLPIWVYRKRLGVLLGHRFVRIHHTGRSRGRRVVVEAVGHDPATGAVTVASGRTGLGQELLLIMPAPTVTPVASSMRMNEPVVRFLE